MPQESSASRVRAKLRGCEKRSSRINHTMRMPAKIGLKRVRLRLLFQRRCGAQFQHGVIPSLRANLPFSLVEASSDKSSQSLSSAFARPIRPRNDGPEIHFGQVSNSTSSHSRGAFASELCMTLSLERREGAGNAGCALHPRSRVQGCTKKSAHEHTGSAEAIRHSLRNGFTAYAVISSATNSSCHRRCRLDGQSDPVGSVQPPAA